MLALMLVAGLTSLVPARWNSGDPKSLELLQGGPVNCILVDYQNWTPALLQAARQNHIATFGVIHPGAQSIEQAREAVRLKLHGVVLEGEYDPPALQPLRAALAGLTVVELPSRGRMRLDGGDAITGTWQGLWPGIQIEHGGGSATAGPTSTPWINTNTGFLRFARAATDSAVWVGERPPPGAVFPVNRYCLAVADAAIAGARWIVSVDADLDRRLLAGESHALQSWKQIQACVRYFEDKSEWRKYRPYSQLAVVQDPASGGLLSGGILDLLSVLHKAARPVPARRLSSSDLQSVRVVLNMDADILSVRQKGDLEQFARAGGVLVNPPAGWRFPAISAEQTMPNRRQLDRIQPIWEATYDATVSKNFGVRTFNTASVLFNLLAAPGGKSLLVHLVNYADYAAEDVTVQVLGQWRRARLYSPEGETRELPVYPVADGTGIDIDRIGVVSTLRLD
jgi:hypothetical protein